MGGHAKVRTSFLVLVAASSLFALLFISTHTRNLNWALECGKAAWSQAGGVCSEGKEAGGLERDRIRLSLPRQLRVSENERDLFTPLHTTTAHHPPTPPPADLEKPAAHHPPTPPPADLEKPAAHHPPTHPDSEEPAYAPFFRETPAACPGLDLANASDRSAKLSLFRKKLKEYARFHRQQQVTLAKSQHSTLKAPTFTWSCPNSSICHGMGDQLYRIQLSFLLAMVSGRAFFIHWDPISMKTAKFLRPNAIRWNQFAGDSLMVTPEVTEPDNPVNLVRPLPQTNQGVLKSLYNLTQTHLTLTNEICMPFSRCIQSVGDQDTRTANLFDQFGIPWNSSASDLRYLQSTILHYLFKFEEKVLARLDHIQKQTGLNVPYIGVHLRTGFLGNRYQETRPGNKFSRRKIIRSRHIWRETLKCSVELANSLLGEGSPLFLATDSYLVKDLARAKYLGRIVTLDLEVQHPAMAETTGNPALINRTAAATPTVVGRAEAESWSRTERGRDALLDGGMGTWLDFLLLAHSHAIVLPFSGFSIIASNLCFIPDKNVYNAPKCTVSSS